MARIEIAAFDFTDKAEVKFWEHRIVREQVEAVLDSPWAVIRNRAGRAASFVLIGRDDQSRCLAIPIAPTHDRLIWRPIYRVVLQAKWSREVAITEGHEGEPSALRIDAGTAR